MVKVAKKKKITAKKAAPKKSKPMVGKSVKSSVKDTAISAGKSLLGLGGKKGGAHKQRNARQLLKSAYERRAKRQIRMGMLGQARRTLRKKATVI